VATHRTNTLPAILCQRAQVQIQPAPNLLEQHFLFPYGETKRKETRRKERRRKETRRKETRSEKGKERDNNDRDNKRHNREEDGRLSERVRENVLHFLVLVWVYVWRK